MRLALLLPALCICVSATAAEEDARLRKLEAENNLLKAEVLRLKKELRSLKASVQEIIDRQDKLEDEAAAARAQLERAKEAVADVLRPEKIESLNNVFTTLGQYMQMTPAQRKKALPRLRKQAKEAERLWAQPPK